MIDRQIRNREIFAEQLLRDFEAKITGLDVERLTCRDPEDAFHVGKLSPLYYSNVDLSSKTNIHRIGVQFVISKNAVQSTVVKVLPQGIFYYRVFPTLNEQRKAFVRAARIKISEQVPRDFDELIDYLKREHIDNLSCELLPVYKPFKIDNFEFQFNLGEIVEPTTFVGYKSLFSDCNDILEKAIPDIESSKDFYHVIREEVLYEDLLSEKDWQAFLKDNSRSHKSLNVWAFDIDCEIRPAGPDTVRISIGFCNRAEREKYNDKARINTIFNSNLNIKLDGANFRETILDYFENDYKYDKYVYAVGENCSVEVDSSICELKTTHLPVFKQYRLKTNEKIEVTFASLISDPIKKLKEIELAMKDELTMWVKYAEEKNFTGDSAKQINNEIKNFELEIQRFSHGIDLIHKYDDVRDAFRLMNRTFADASKGFSKWRLFQIVFIVSIIPDICASEYSIDEIGNTMLDKLDLLYFPTGGGKTEAFFGVVVFTLFFDRLRGKKAGVSAIIKYPLRLLSIQQVERLAIILASAELIRVKHPDTKESKEFALGYFVGESNTPNKITSQLLEKLETMGQAELNNNYKIMEKCPFCGADNLNIKILREEIRIVHCCSNPECPSGGILPLYIVDQGIYRYLPAVIISTLDKFAALGNQSNFRNLMGEVLFECPVHGYSSKRKCTMNEFCQVDTSTFHHVDLYDPAPTLLIQDELHLVRESLGVYAAHYETLFQYFLEHLVSKPKKLKIIGASATISAYKDQGYHLYMKDVNRFPCSSPFLDRNFYSYIDKNEINRYILGYAPFGKAIINSVVYSMKYLKEIIWKYHKNPDLLKTIPGAIWENAEDEIQDILDDYWIFLEYNNVKLDGNKVINALDDPINRELRFEEIQPFEMRKMTGDDTFQDVRRILSEIETTTSVRDGFNLIAATSMISHGVDANRFNVMFFFGTPNNTAEYIQAYSRAGRKFPGLIIMIMRPTRERDQSYLRHFIKFHDFKDILVEPVPINRWATRAIDRTFPGVLSTILINHYDYHLQQTEGGNIYMMNKLKEVICKDLIPIDELKQHIKGAYGCLMETRGKQYEEAIEEKVDMFYRNIQYETFENNVYIIEGLQKLGFLPPMRSLRDADIPVIVEVN